MPPKAKTGVHRGGSGSHRAGNRGQATFRSASSRFAYRHVPAIQPVPVYQPLQYVRGADGHRRRRGTWHRVVGRYGSGYHLRARRACRGPRPLRNGQQCTACRRGLRHPYGRRSNGPAHAQRRGAGRVYQGSHARVDGTPRSPLRWNKRALNPAFLLAAGSGRCRT